MSVALYICGEVGLRTRSLSLRTLSTCRLHLTVELAERSVTYSTYGSEYHPLSNESHKRGSLEQFDQFVSTVVPVYLLRVIIS